jgi:hypothetical protein
MFEKITDRFWAWVYERSRDGRISHANRSCPGPSFAEDGTVFDDNATRESMCLWIHFADGGLIIEQNTRDKKDNNHSKLIVLNSDQDIGESLRRIITMHGLVK